MPGRDDLDKLIDDLVEHDPRLELRVAAALERRELARQLAARRREAGFTQTEVADRMGTSQGQVARYAAAVGATVTWSIESPPRLKRPDRRTARRVPAA